MQKLATLVGALALGALQPAHAAPEPKTATPQEQASFFDYYNATHTAQGLLRPQFAVSQGEGKHGKRRVTAAVDGPAQRLVLPLCRQPRTVFDYDPRAPKEARWREAPPVQTLVWVHHQQHCGAQPDAPVRLLQPLPDMEILQLIQGHPTLLANARLLMAGNTSCSTSRNRGFHLTGLDRGKDGLPVLVFASDVAGEARVSVRRSRNELLPWTVACSGPR